MVASYVGIDSGGPSSGAQSISSLSPSSGDVLVLSASGYNSGAGAPPHIYADATLLAAFTSILWQGETPTAGGNYTVGEVRDRVADGSEPANYSITADSDAYGYFRAMVHLTGAERQTSSTAVYSVTGGRDIPAYTVDNNDSIAVAFATGYSKEVVDSLWTGDGWTSRTSLDGGFFRVYTKPVAAGSYAEQSGPGGDNDAMAVVIIYEPISGAASYVVKFHDGTSVVTATTVSVHDGVSVKPATSVTLG